MEDERCRSERGGSKLASRDHLLRQERDQSQRRDDRLRARWLHVPGLGDGGNANDVGASHIEPGGNAQNMTTPLGKMLRIDPILPSLKPASPDATSPNGQYRI